MGYETPKARKESVEGLPPINTIVIPKTATKSGMIRWLYAMGYSVKDIHHATSISYQMVRNISLSEPKRAAREDLPPLELQYKEDEADIIEAAIDGALDASLMTERKARQKAEKSERRQLKRGLVAGVEEEEEEVDEITEQTV